MHSWKLALRPRARLVVPLAFGTVGLIWTTARAQPLTQEPAAIPAPSAPNASSSSAPMAPSAEDVGAIRELLRSQQLQIDGLREQIRERDRR
ncbi:MAG TPA: hypothetical protein VG963_32725, partial [Polyangiaceae bacterium]|nr:hypothetical protein [Polyangiaceae bacterium]